MPPARHSETARQAVHMAMGGFALLLRWIAWWQALLLAALALAFNLLALPAFAEHLYRPGDRARGLHGIVFYPIAVLLLLVAFPRHLHIVGAAWAILAIGDGMATIVGRAVGGPRWPWNRDKTVAGSAALFVLGGAAGVFLAWWCRDAGAHRVSPHFILIAPFVAAFAAAAVETIPVRLDDNLSVALTAGGVLWLVSLMHVSALRAFAAGPLRDSWLLAVGVNVVFAAAGFAARTVSVSGAVAGAAIGTVIFVTLGWQGWLLLFLTFLSASITSRLGLRRKTLLGIAEERGGRRGAGNAMANTGVAAMAAVLSIASAHHNAARWAFAAALAAAGSDTIASEIGKAWGRRTYSIASFRSVPPGTSGAISLEGTAAGLVGALALGSLAVALGIVPGAALAPIVVAATVAAFIESGLGATLEAPGVLNNDMLNFITSAVAACIAAGLEARLG
jgi:uncharacterized protein (TIGR00297 family)